MVGPFAWFKWEALFRDWTVFAEGFKTTIMVAVLSLTLALILGIVFGVLGTSQWKLAKLLSRVYVEFIQNTPLVIQVFFLYHGLPHMGIMLPVFTVGVLGVGVYHGAYIAEVVRAGIESIHKGQMEAALSQGFSFWGAMRHVILPQASRIVLPPLTNQAVNLIKNTSVLAMVAGGDLMYRADSWSSENIYYGPAYVAVGLLYLLLCLPLATLTRRLEGKTGVSA
ncbi:amino acid ABC transporter permease [Desulfosporosinus sp.]|uniref:amino acid ABC transporter permease n=1 Tax=Desulfosporosinus sp. TaxID=157907 RepID=UPI000E7FC313|nr:amino acid ABC transporter permease [Desulfosporosinus sp.]MBC2722185.1 amino acid ABC transporter permease [Desulfosporosinus sp.]MBC2728402.1 amino acid ABC transporter permease [Desulfosporosinus sp.]HBV85115.1 polar amino acid ABC transporter permease [Desulfosporosinus sp.]